MFDNFIAIDLSVQAHKKGNFGRKVPQNQTNAIEKEEMKCDSTEELNQDASQALDILKTSKKVSDIENDQQAEKSKEVIPLPLTEESDGERNVEIRNIEIAIEEEEPVSPRYLK